MAVYSTLKPENLVLNNVYLSYAYWYNTQVNIVKVEQGSNNITSLNPFNFKIIANDGFKLDYDNCVIEIDTRELVYENLASVTNPKAEEILTVNFKEFETATKIGEYKTGLSVDTRDCNYKNVDLTNFKTIQKTVNGISFYINLIDIKETSCMIDIFTGTGKYKGYYSVDGTGKYPYSAVQTFTNSVGSTLPNKYLRIYKINLNVKTNNTGGGKPETPLSKNIFTTYVVNPQTLTSITGNQELYNEIIINTLSYPIKFKEEDLIETTIKTGGMETSVNGKVFNKNIVKREILKFSIPKFNEVEQCTLNLPFNNAITLDYNDLENKTITGTIVYEVLTASTTLIINNGDYNIYKGSFNLASDVPFKPTGEFSNYSKTESRLSNDVPLLIIKCSQVVKQEFIIKGKLVNNIQGILKSELELLNTLTENGVIINEY